MTIEPSRVPSACTISAENESLVGYKLKEVSRIASVHSNFAMTKLVTSLPLYELEKFLLDHPNIVTIELSGYIFSMGLMNRVTALAHKCHSLSKIVIETSEQFIDLSIKNIWNWVAALRYQDHLQLIEFRFKTIDLIRLSLFQYYLQRETAYRITAFAGNVFQIVPTFGSVLPKTFSHLEEVVGSTKKNLLVKQSLSEVEKLGGDIDQFREYCSEFFAWMRSSFKDSEILAMIRFFEEKSGMSLGSLEFTSQSGKVFSVSKFAYDEFVSTPAVSDLSDFSDEAVEGFTYFINHGLMFWNITEANFLPLLALGVKFEVLKCVIELETYLKGNLLTIIQEIKQSDTSLQPFIIEKTLAKFDIDLEGLVAFFCYLKAKAFDFFHVTRGLAIAISHQVPGVSLEKALRYAFRHFNPIKISFDWHGALDVDLSVISKLLESYLVKLEVEVVLHKVLHKDTPLCKFLEETKKIQILSLVVPYKFETIKNVNVAANCLNLATLLATVNKSLGLIHILHTSFDPAFLSRFAGILATKSTVRTVMFKIYDQVNFKYSAFEASKNNWGPFFSQLVPGTQLQKLMIAHPIDVSDPQTQFNLLYFLYHNTSLNELNLVLSNISKDFMQRLFDVRKKAIQINKSPIIKIFIKDLTTSDKITKAKIYQLRDYHATETREHLTIQF